jgi:hypothetical protein
MNPFRDHVMFFHNLQYMSESDVKTIAAGQFFAGTWKVVVFAKMWGRRRCCKGEEEISAILGLTIRDGVSGFIQAKAEGRSVSLSHLYLLLRYLRGTLGAGFKTLSLFPSPA